MAETYRRPLPGEKEKKGHPCLYGCLALIVVVCLLAVIGGVVAYSVFGRLLDTYTDTKPMDLPKVEVSAEQGKQLWARLGEFKAAADAGNVATLTLSADDLNAMLRSYPNIGPFGNAVYFALEGSTVKGQVSLPLASFGLPGRFVNGAGTFSIGISNGRLELYLEELSVKGQPLQKELMDGMRNQNLAEGANQDPQARDLLSKVQSLSVENGQIILTSKGGAKQGA